MNGITDEDYGSRCACCFLSFLADWDKEHACICTYIYIHINKHACSRLMHMYMSVLEVISSHRYLQYQPIPNGFFLAFCLYSGQQQHIEFFSFYSYWFNLFLVEYMTLTCFQKLKLYKKLSSVKGWLHPRSVPAYYPLLGGNGLYCFPLFPFCVFYTSSQMSLTSLLSL